MTTGYPRIERNAFGRPIWNQGPYGMSPALANMVLPSYWPSDWPSDWIAADDPRVRRYFRTGIAAPTGTAEAVSTALRLTGRAAPEPDRLLIYYSERFR
jgi:hypothetical protein